MSEQKIEVYKGPAGGWGALRSVGHALLQQDIPLKGAKTLLSAKLARHGVHLNHAALDNPKAHLCAPPRARTEIGRAIASLEEVMDDLGHYTRHAPAASA